MRLKLYRETWCAVWSEQTPKGSRTRRSSLRTDDRNIAEQRFKDFVRAQKTPAETVGEIYAAYVKDKRGNDFDLDKEWSWRALKGHFANLRPDHVTRSLCRDYTAFRRAKKISDGTIHRELGMLKAALRWHSPNTPAVVELPSKPPPKDRFLTRDEFHTLIEHCDAPHIKLFAILALSTAARASALLEMTWDQVDLAKGIIRLSKGTESKLKGRATVPMTGFAREALELAYKARESDYVIEWAGKNVQSVKKGFRMACKRAKLEDVSPHVLRHTAAVWMAEAGIPMSEIAQYLGHRTSSITERVYARYSPEYLKKAANALEVQMPRKNTVF